MKRSIKLAAVLLMSVALIASGCTQRTQTGGGSSLADLTGQVNADGSSTVFLITQAIFELFRDEAPNVRTDVREAGTGGGFKRFCVGETDIQDASRPIKEGDPEATDEAEKKGEVGLCEENNVEYVELTVATDGLSNVINIRNDWAKCLTVDELKKIWEPNSTVVNWNQVRPDFPNRPLTKDELFGAGTDSGTFDYFTAEIVGEEGASRTNYNPTEDDNDTVRGVGGTRAGGEDGNVNALGYFGFGYYEQNKDKLKVLAVDGGDGCVTPSKETIQDGTYKPLSRPLFIYISKKAAERKEVQEIVDFYLENVNSILTDVGYVEIPNDELQKEKDEWEAFKTGKGVKAPGT
jgi:phosphate transport system substrate-binding protein